MWLIFLFLIGAASILANPILVCREDKSDACVCSYDRDRYNRKFLIITCNNWANLNTTDIFVPDSAIKGCHFANIILNNTGIDQLISPLISNKQLSGLVNELQISGHKLSKIDSKVFDGLSKLQTLKLVQNDIDGKLLSSAWLTSNLGKTLKNLDLSYNNLETIQKGVFSNLVSLEYLRIVNSGLQKISDLELPKLKHLTSINIGNNKFVEITEDSFGGLSRLTDLDVYGSQIKEIDANAFNKLFSLQWLYLDNNDISIIPDSSKFANPNKLTFLSLKSNQIRKISDRTFERFHSLSILDLSDNEIEQISDSSFDGLERLSTLFLINNKISVLPDGVFKPLKHLRNIDLSGNRIERINQLTFDSLDSLSGITLDNNNIQTIEDGSFNKLNILDLITLKNNKKLSLSDRTFDSSTLNHLILSGCNLEFIPIGLLKNLPKLNYLQIENNQLTSVPAALRNTKSIRYLNLTSNNISQIQGNAFGNNPSLWMLYLDDLKYLSVINDCAFCGLTSLGYISLNGNNNLKQINENAFGYLKSSVDKASDIGTFQIHDGGLKTLQLNMLPWERIRISVLGNPANCDPRMDWMFRNKKYNIDKRPTARYYDPNWCEKCKHDLVCQKLYGFNETTTKSPAL